MIKAVIFIVARFSDTVTKCFISETSEFGPAEKRYDTLTSFSKLVCYGFTF